ncbi:MAG: NADPH:quinone oxidoreductase family protein [Myxococcales bacterium]|nr:NADPH:quinone oxidoreductase family protein [Myxococcales bacterium]
MRAARCNEYGPPENITLEDLPTPEFGEGQVLVDVRAASVNYPDVLVMANRYQVSVPVPFTPGSEFSGSISAVGPGVARLAVGDAVYGATFVGAFAEQAVVPEGSLTLVPEGVDLVDAAAFSVVYGTAYYALTTTGRLEAGDTLVVLGAAGGVGLASVAIGKLLGARVIAAASSAEKLAVCRSCGADETIDYSRENLKERIKELTGGVGADVAIDPVGGEYSEAAYRAMRWRGRYVVVGFAAGEIPRIPLNLVLLKGAALVGFDIRPFHTNAPEELAERGAELKALLANGKLRPHIASKWPLSRTADALKEVAERRATGKVIIDPTLP